MTSFAFKFMMLKPTRYVLKTETDSFKFEKHDSMIMDVGHLKHTFSNFEMCFNLLTEYLVLLLHCN